MVLVKLLAWAEQHGGHANFGIGVIYADDDNVIPDVVWISSDRLARGLDAQGHLSLYAAVALAALVLAVR
jgi:hypothetical protein